MAVHLPPQSPIETRPQPAPQITRRPRTQRAHLPRLPRPHRSRRSERHAATTAPRPRTTTITSSAPNIALAGLELLVGYEWLASGVDKLLFGGFPGALGGLLAGTLSGGRLPGFFTALLRALVVPNVVAFGYLIEWSETLAGLALIAAGLLVLLRPLARRWASTGRPYDTAFSLAAQLIDRLAPVAAAGTVLLGLSFFFLDGLPTPWFTPGIAYGGALDTGLFLAAASAVLVMSHLASRRG